MSTCEWYQVPRLHEVWLTEVLKYHVIITQPHHVLLSQLRHLLRLLFYIDLRLLPDNFFRRVPLLKLLDSVVEGATAAAQLLIHLLALLLIKGVLPVWDGGLRAAWVDAIAAVRVVGWLLKYGLMLLSQIVLDLREVIVDNFELSLSFLHDIALGLG